MAGSASTLWMGDLEPTMDEYFVQQAFSMMGENPVHVKIIRDRLTGLPRGYGFLDFGDEEAAERALLRCNGKPIPNAMQPKMFRLNHANNSTGGGGGGGGGGYQQGYSNGGGGGRPQYGSSSNELSMFVGDLSADVDDTLLYQAFSQRYPSVRAAKVVLDPTGLSKGFGFVRFSDGTEYQEALVDMQHSLLVGSKPIRVGVANPRRAAAGPGGQRVFYRNQSSDYY
ncbi:tRNA selenocysteine 1-associated protein 1-like [Dermacentor andersoni]|nr:tRNA selenocysteine 1-associated protein 1-like [Dermacentor andersoni]